MRMFALTAFMADAEKRARSAGVVDVPVDALRNKGAGRSERKRRLLADAARRAKDNPAAVVSYF